jgi:2-polyprenyl-3-methyl-5-hydroxy-6-metoxy-1,4-benzoquinol methylase
MIQRLDGFYGVVERRINHQIATLIKGQTVLDIGCGFGSLVDFLQQQGFQATGIDMLAACIQAGKEKFPAADLRHVTGERLDFFDHSFDTIILKDVIHHIYAEDDINTFLQDVKRICRQRLIIVDPNPMKLLLLARKLIGHIDPICPPAEAERLLKEAGFTIAHRSFSEIIAFPLSGGYISKPFVSKGRIGDLILAVDRWLLKAVRALRLEHLLCWRYILAADQTV